MALNKRIVFFGFSMAGAEVLRALIEARANVSAVYTYEDNPAENWFDSVKTIARENKIPVFTPEKLEASDVENIKSFAPDIILSVYYRSLLPDGVLSAAGLGAFNIHGSLLPKYRGRAPVNWMILNGETEGGATMHYMTSLADAGDIVDAEKVGIDFEDTALTLTQKISAAAARIIKRTLPLIEAGTVKGVKQDLAQGSYFGRRTASDGLIDWTWDAPRIYNLIRAVTKPFPGAFAPLDGKKIIIWKAKPLNKKSGLPAGEIVSEKPFIIATGGNDLEILEYEIKQPLSL